MKTVFEEMNGSYTVQGDYRLPDLKLPEKEYREIGVGATAQALFEAISQGSLL